MKKFKRLGAILLACVLCISSSVVCFAADGNNNMVEPTAGGQLLYSTSAYFPTGSGSCTITTEEGNWDAQFIVSLSGNPSGSYYVSMRAANGTEQYFGFMNADGDSDGLYVTQGYAKAGTYTFYVTQSTGSRVPITAIVQILD